MKRIILFFAISFIAGWVYGQGEMDAFNFSRNEQIGTARGIAMGGAFGALGAEVTGIAQNPAGIGVYRSSEVVATMDFMSNNIKTNTEGYSVKKNKFKFAFDNVAYMGYMPLSGDVLKAFNFGFSYNRLKNFDRNYSMSGKDLPGSLSDYTAEICYRIPVSDLGFRNGYDPYRASNQKGLPWMGILGYEAGIINDVANDEYQSAWPKGEDIIDNRLQVSERGHIESYDFSCGANISNKLYLGTTLSITDIYKAVNSYYVENFFYILNNDLTGFDLDNGMETTGSGFQISLGAIFKPVNALRLGIAYHSPTWYSMEDSRWGNLVADLPTDETWESHAPDGQDVAITSYKLQTPDRWVASAAMVLGTKAILSIDYEYANYSRMKLKDLDGFEFAGDNMLISQHFKGAGTLKAGLEVRVTPQLSIRGGYCWGQSPLVNEFKNGEKEVMMGLNSTIPHFTLEGDANTYSCGLGYKITPELYIDLAFSFKTQKDDLYTYSPVYATNGKKLVDVIPSKFTNNTHKGLVTLGYKF